MNAQPCRLVVLISGRGSNMQAIVEACRQRGSGAQVVAVVANTAAAAGLDWAQQQGIATQVVAHRDYAGREAFDAELARVIEGYRPDYVLLAGFMRILTPAFVARFKARLINIHPSLLPAFPGLHTHRQALDTGVQWHGCSIHFVTPALDQGPIIAQGILPVMAGDTPETLAQRLLRLEHVLYACVTHWLGQGRVQLDDHGCVQVRGVASRGFVLMDDRVVLAGEGAALCAD